MENILIPNQAELNKKIAEFKKAGVNSIHIISDFERTLTKAYFQGKLVPSLISQLREGPYLSKEYQIKAHALFNKYHPIEISTEIDLETKKEKMKEWWSTHYKLLVDSGLDRKTINQAVKDMISTGRVSLRKGVKEFFQKAKEIPLIIMSSSGLGNIVLDFLKLQDIKENNIHFIGNTLEFDKSEKFTGIKDNKIIHVFNKNEAELKNLSIYRELEKRKNIILLGDSLGDLQMSEGISYKNIIKICFLNEEPEKNLETFKKHFDIIITNDGDFSYVNEILSKII